MKKKFNNVVLQCFTFQLGQYICLISTKHALYAGTDAQDRFCRCSST